MKNADRLKKGILVETKRARQLKGRCISGADPGFQVRGAHFKKLRRAEGGAKIFGVFRPKNHIFSNFRGGAPPSGSAPAFLLI